MGSIVLATLVLISIVLDSAIGVPFASLMLGVVTTARLTSETPMTLAEAARTLPGGAVHVSTIHRWRMKGVRGVKLETFLRGGVRHTSREAIERFFEAVTAAADGDATPVRTSRQRERAIEQAERACERAGI